MLRILNRSIDPLSIRAFGQSRIPSFGFITLRFKSATTASLTPEIKARVEQIKRSLPEAIANDYAAKKGLKDTRMIAKTKRALEFASKETSKMIIIPKMKTAVQLESRVFRKNRPMLLRPHILYLKYGNKGSEFDRGKTWSKLSEAEREYWTRNHERFVKLYDVFTPRPKKPTTSYLNFLAVKGVSGNTREEITELVSKRAKEWRELSEEEKEKYKHSAEDSDKYKKELEEWKQRRLVEYAMFEQSADEFKLDPPTFKP